MFANGVAGPDEKKFLLSLAARKYHHNRFGLFNPGEIEKITILAIGIIYITGVNPFRSAPQNQHGVRTQQLHQSLTAAMQVVLKCCGSGDACQQQCDRRQKQQFVSR